MPVEVAAVLSRYQGQIAKAGTLLKVGVTNANEVRALVAVLNAHAAQSLAGAELAAVQAANNQRVVEADNRVEQIRPHLAELLTVSMWSAFDAAVMDLCLHIIKSEWSKSAAVARITMTVGDFMGLDDDAKARVFLNELLTSSRARGAPGVARYEKVLDLLEVSGPVTTKARKWILRWAETRHVIVHRAGAIDDKFVKAVPWAKCTVGDVVAIGPEEFVSFGKASTVYLVELCRRLVEKDLAVSVATEEQIRQQRDALDKDLAEP
jgi:hypothetical protein